jgi:transcriptional antiterminator NusG
MVLFDDADDMLPDLDDSDLEQSETPSMDIHSGIHTSLDDEDLAEAASAVGKTKDHRVAVLSEKQLGNISVSASEEEGMSRPKKPARKRWYIVHTYSGHENKVKVNLERRIESMNMGDKIFRVEAPQKSVTKIKDGKRTEKEERVFPGYVLVEMIMDDDSWYVVRHTPGVTKFVGSQKKPIPAKDSEIKRILLKSAPTAAPVKIDIDLKVGDVVKIISGPFADFEGNVTEVSPEKERLKASVSIFGRETPVELAFNQIQKSH